MTGATHGKLPTVAEVKAVHDEMLEAGKPTSQRAIAEEMTSRGWKIGHKTVGRYKQSGWRELGTSGPRPLVNDGTPAGIAKPVREAVKKLPKDEQETLKTGLDGTVGTPLSDMELEAVAKRLEELMKRDVADLGEIETKTRLAMNIIVMEQATRRANILALVPRDTAQLVTAMTEAVKSAPYGALPVNLGVNPGDNAILIEHQPMHPVAVAIAEFKKRQNAA